MKAISLKQPWASFVAMGQKTIETRTWRTNYRGDLLIVSSKQIDRNYPNHNFLSLGLRFGQALAVVKLVDCRPMMKEDEEKAMCPCSPGRYAWILKNIRKIQPFPIKGQLGIYEVECYPNYLPLNELLKGE